MKLNNDVVVPRARPQEQQYGITTFALAVTEQNELIKSQSGQPGICTNMETYRNVDVFTQRDLQFFDCIMRAVCVAGDEDLQASEAELAKKIIGFHGSLVIVASVEGVSRRICEHFLAPTKSR
jgi:hypothetical protein